MPADLVVQCGLGHPQGLGRAGEVAAVLAQGLGNQGALKSIHRGSQGLYGRGFCALACLRGKWRSAGGNAQHRPLGHVAQFTHIAGPVVAQQLL